MSDPFCRRRFLIDFDSNRLGQVFTDVLVIGGGIAGLRAAIEAAGSADVILLTKDAVPDCNTAAAQGGIAVVTDPADSIDAHIADTLQVGCGLNNAAAVQALAAQGPSCVKELIDWGARFDLEDGAVALGMEGGHSARRIVHALGDATGRELSRALARKLADCSRARVFAHCFVIDLIAHEGRCLGAITQHPKYGYQAIWAARTVLATGGAGMLFRETTNTAGATADGHAIAFRAGATMRDMEFVQFHPTALYVAGAARALVSEAVRGEGAYLVDREGHRFMQGDHPDAELAPRDVVSRAIIRHMARTGATCAYLDVRHFPAGRFAARFPNIARLCADVDIDPARDLIPVRPAAHYMIGGVAADLDGNTSLPGLLACGEAAATGVHGANRLASNSLLEGLVFGCRVGRLAGEQAAANGRLTRPLALSHRTPPSPRTELDVADVRNSLRAICWRNAGIDRTADRLVETLEIIDFWGRYVMDKVLDDRAGWETQNLLTVGRLVALSALAREESRGVHFRSDFPQTDDARFKGHVVLTKTIAGIAQAFEE